MNFKLNFDILQNKISRLNQLIPNNSSLFTTGTPSESFREFINCDNKNKTNKLNDKSGRVNNFLHNTNSNNRTKNYIKEKDLDEQIMNTKEKIEFYVKKYVKRDDTINITNQKNLINSRNFNNLNSIMTLTDNDKSNCTNIIDNQDKSKLSNSFIGNKDIQINSSFSKTDLLTESVHQFCINQTLNKEIEENNSELILNKSQSSHKDESSSHNLSDLVDNILDLKIKDEFTENEENEEITKIEEIIKIEEIVQSTLNNIIISDLKTNTFTIVHDHIDESSICKDEVFYLKESNVEKESIRNDNIRNEIQYTISISSNKMSNKNSEEIYVENHLDFSNNSSICKETNQKVNDCNIKVNSGDYLNSQEDNINLKGNIKRKIINNEKINNEEDKELDDSMIIQEIINNNKKNLINSNIIEKIIPSSDVIYKETESNNIKETKPNNTLSEINSISPNNNIDSPLIFRTSPNINSSPEYNEKRVKFSDNNTIILYKDKNIIQDLQITKEDGTAIKHKKKNCKEFNNLLKSKKRPKSILNLKIDPEEVKNLALERLNNLINECEMESKSENGDIEEKSRDNPIRLISLKSPSVSKMMKRNLKFVQELQNSIKKGIPVRKKRSLTPRKAKIVEHCHKFKNNPQKFFSKPPCEIVLKSLDLKIIPNFDSNYDSNLSRSSMIHPFNSEDEFMNQSDDNSPNRQRKGQIKEMISKLNIEEKLKKMDDESNNQNDFSSLSSIPEINSPAEKSNEKRKISL